MTAPIHFYDSRLCTLPARQHPTCCRCQEPIAAYVGGIGYCLRHLSAVLQAMPDRTPVRYGATRAESGPSRNTVLREISDIGTNETSIPESDESLP